MHVRSVNVGAREPNPHKRSGSTGFRKRPVRSVELREPGPKHGGLGSGLVGDFIGDVQHHGGTRQAVYAFAREDLDWWAGELGREFPDGAFGENLTTLGLEVNAALVGERWRVGTGDDACVLQVTDPRIPCATFAGVMAEPRWVKRFSAAARPGAYLQIVEPGVVRPGDPIEVVFRPDHDVDITTFFLAVTTRRDLQRRLATAADYLDAETHAMLARGGSSDLG